MGCAAKSRRRIEVWRLVSPPMAVRSSRAVWNASELTSKVVVEDLWGSVVSGARFRHEALPCSPARSRAAHPRVHRRNGTASGIFALAEGTLPVR